MNAKTPLDQYNEYNEYLDAEGIDLDELEGWEDLDL